ncbi:unnamed protein product, partial [Diabrotica balteata]
ILITDDKKYFTLSQFGNEGQRWGFYICNVQDALDKVRFKGKLKYADKTLVWCPIAEAGVSKPFVRRVPGKALNADNYVDRCLTKLVQFINTHQPNDEIIFGPDLVLCHYARRTTDWLTAQNINFVPKRDNPPNVPQKTKMMTNMVPSEEIQINNNKIELIDKYTYLGHEIKIPRDNQTCELNRRITLEWAAYGRMRDIFKTNIPIHLKRKAFNQCILPANGEINAGLTLKDRVRNEEKRRRTGVDDIILRINKQKWRWAGHVARMEDGRLTKRLLEWRPRADKRSRCRPPTRWTDELRKIETNWIAAAKDRENWRRLVGGLYPTMDVKMGLNDDDLLHWKQNTLYIHIHQCKPRNSLMIGKLVVAQKRHVLITVIINDAPAALTSGVKSSPMMAVGIGPIPRE